MHTSGQAHFCQQCQVREQHGTARGVQTCSFGAVVRVQFHAAFAHTLPSFSQFRGCFFGEFPFGDSCCEAKEAHSPWPHNCSCSIQHLLIFSVLPPLGLRVLSHLPCHDSSVNHLEPSFARQGSMELIVHHNVSWLFQHPEKKSPDGCAYGTVINSGVIAKPHWILIASCYKRKQVTGL